jgi:hypothetical protein
MRPERFQEFALAAYRQAPGIQAAEPWQDGTKRPYGIRVTLASGANLWHSITGQSKEGDDYSQPEEPLEKEAPEPVTLPEIGGGPVPLKTLEAYLAAVVNNTGHREIAATYTYSERPLPPKNPGFGVHFHSGARIFCVFVQAAGPGARPGGEYDLPQQI